VWPRLAGAPLASFRLANWGFWLITLGIGSMALVLSAQGCSRASCSWPAPSSSTPSSHQAVLVAAHLHGLSMDVGMSLRGAGAHADLAAAPA
jgi:hypothetical protein